MSMQDPFVPTTETSPPPFPAAGAVPPPMPPALPVMGPVVREEDKTLGMLCHLLSIFTGFLGPLILWLVKRDTSPFVDHHGRESLNFQITVFLAMLALVSVTFILIFLLIGIIFIPVIFLLQILVIVAEVMAAVAAQRGDWHRYPFCLRLL
ncbi:MAG: DUF4870 domain-containing protein [Verrucomicrobiaceae bacterium]|nr:MAG: DUF4870 domain-containing protein [Verrucomicrobiaceae bacterium]